MTQAIEPTRNGKLEALEAETYKRAVALVERAAAAGIPIKVIETHRTRERQAWLYASGRTREGQRVTNARPGYTWHEYGRAFDVVILDGQGKAWWGAPVDRWDRLGKIGEDLGLEWGGRFRFRDLGHFQHTRLTFADARKLVGFDLVSSAGSGLEVETELERIVADVVALDAGEELPA